MNAYQTPNQCIKIYAGDDDEWNVVMTQSLDDGTVSPLDITDRELDLLIKRKNTDNILISYRATKTDAINGKALIAIKKEDTADLLVESGSDNNYTYFLRLTEPSVHHTGGTKTKTIESGTLWVCDKVPEVVV